MKISFFFSDCSVLHHSTRLCEKKNRKKEKKKEREREREREREGEREREREREGGREEREREREEERKKERKTLASVSAGVRRECWDESKKEARNEKGGDGEKRKPLISSPSSFFHFVLLSLQLWRNNSFGNACYAGK